MATFGFIGIGNMGYAILKGLLHVYPKEELIFTDVNKSRVKQVFEETKVVAVEDNISCVSQVKYVILAIKPQYYSGVLEELKEVLTPEQVVISIAPGITIAALQEALGGNIRIVRAMPNTPALVGEGMTGVCYQPELFTEEEERTIAGFFQSFGRMKLVEERLMNAVVCVSGSSPAFVYMFIEALADGAVKYGLPREVAYEMAAQTLIGSAKMVLETGEHPGRLKDQVCSPGGTTIAGVSALEEHGFRNAVIKASDACYEKCNSIK